MGGPITGHPSSLKGKDAQPGTASITPDTKEKSTPVIMGHGHHTKQSLLDHQGTTGTTPDETRPHRDKTPNIWGHPKGGTVWTPGIPQPPVTAEDGKAICLAWHTKGRCNATQCPREHDHVQYKRPTYAQLSQWCETHYPVGPTQAVLSSSKQHGGMQAGNQRAGDYGQKVEQ